MDKFISLISTPDFWRSIIYLLTAAGIAIDTNQTAQIVSGGMALSGVLHAYEVSKKK